MTKAIANKKLMQMEELMRQVTSGATNSTHHEHDEEQPKSKKRDLDLLNLYVKELREPKLVEVS